jgi:hypothetical protein
MVAVPDVAVGGIAVYAVVLHLFLAYRLGKAEGEEGTLSASEADVASSRDG